MYNSIFKSLASVHKLKNFEFFEFTIYRFQKLYFFEKMAIKFIFYFIFCNFSISVNQWN